jgi:hypothetical protein
LLVPKNYRINTLKHFRDRNQRGERSKGEGACSSAIIEAVDSLK